VQVQAPGSGRLHRIQLRGSIQQSQAVQAERVPALSGKGGHCGCVEENFFGKEQRISVPCSNQRAGRPAQSRQNANRGLRR